MCVLDTPDDLHGPPNEAEVTSLEKYIPTRTYHLTLLKPCVWLQANNLPDYDVKKKWVSLHSGKVKRVRKAYMFKNY